MDRGRTTMWKHSIKMRFTGSFFSLDWKINIIYAKTLCVCIGAREKYFPFDILQNK